MELKYELSRPASKETIKTCDEGMRGFQDAMVIAARLSGGYISAGVIWLLTRFYKRQVSDKEIKYTFLYLK